MPLCVLWRVVRWSLKVLVHLVFPRSALLGTWKAPENCRHFSAVTRVHWGHVQAPRGSQQVTGAPHPGGVVMWLVSPQVM